MSEWDHRQPSTRESIIVNTFFLLVMLALLGVPIAALAAILRGWAW